MPRVREAGQVRGDIVPSLLLCGTATCIRPDQEHGGMMFTPPTLD